MNLTELLVLSFVVFFFIATITAILVETSRRIFGYIANIRKEKAWRDLYKDE